MKLVEMVDDRKNIEIRADLEHLRKLFIMPDSPDKFLEFGQELLDLIHNFFKEKGGIHSEISIQELSRFFSTIQIPTSPHLLKDILAEIKTRVIAHSVKVGNPYYIGHMTSAIPYFMILIEMIIAALNQNQVKIETAKASTFLERELIAWIHRLVFNRSANFYRTHIQNHRVALGNVCLDGTMANLTALLVARNMTFPADGRFPGIRKAGIYDAFAAGDLQLARVRQDALTPLRNLLDRATFPVVLKEGLRMRGVDAGFCFAPARDMSGTVRQELAGVLATLATA